MYHFALSFLLACTGLLVLTSCSTGPGSGGLEFPRQLCSVSSAFQCMIAHGRVCRFHATCIDQWLNAHCLCPICKHNAALPWHVPLERAVHDSSHGLSHLWSATTSAAVNLLQHLRGSPTVSHPSPADFITRVATENTSALRPAEMERSQSATAVHDRNFNAVSRVS
jgi:hypothetical protein